ncbi:T9SS type A sorting domain-containing protein [bacterium]|nr:T9SS type A sorting domain-containing protein [bacterium]
MIKKILFILLILSGIAQAEIINVPDDFETIQGAIDESENGDTVLVQPGEYVENINFQGKAITVGSMILTTGDEAYIDSTIIDGDERSCVVNFENEEDSTSVLRGFTITNGYQYYGGGIDCQTETSPILIDLIVEDNNAQAYGGGIYITHSSSPHISRVIVRNNYARIVGGGIGIYDDSHPVLNEVIIHNNSTDSDGGGGIWCREASLTMSHCIVSSNTSGRLGGGLYFYQSVCNSMTNCTVTENRADNGDGFFIFGTDGETTILDLVNTIVWGNSHEEMVVNADWYEHAPLLTIQYSDISEGLDGIEIDDIDAIEWGDGNINEDPLFVNPDSSDFHLTEDSPCIDAGDPDSPDDPDQTRCDMGALLFFQGGYVEGFVLDIEDDEPLEEAVIYDNIDQQAITDADGFFRFRSNIVGSFFLTAFCEGYNESILHDQYVNFRDTLTVVFRLTHPELELSEQSISVTVNQGDSTSAEVTMTNHGNGPLEWTAKKRLSGGVDPWTLRQTLTISNMVEDERIEGVVFTGYHYYVSGSNIFQGDDDENMIYVLNRNGQEVHRFRQPGETRYGMKDLAFDGELIWGGADDVIIGFNIEGDSVTCIECPDGSMSVITWDPDHEVFWTARKTGPEIYGISRDGEVVITIPRFGFRLYGLAYREDAPDDSKLYIYHSPDNSSNLLHKINLENQDTTSVRILEHEDRDSPGGCFITDQYEPRNSVFMCITDNGDEDRIDVWQLDSMTGWLNFQPVNGIIPADSTNIFNVIFRSAGFEPDVWEGEIAFNHNAFEGETVLLVTLNIRSETVDDRDIKTIPDEFGITGIYPNPFNSAITVIYNLPFNSDVSLQILDVSGREVETVLNEWQIAGSHNVLIDAERFATGLYLIRLKSGSYAAVKKVALLK